MTLLALALAAAALTFADAAPRRPAPGASSAQAFMARVLRRLNDTTATSLELPQTTAWYDQHFVTLMRDNERLALARMDGPDLDYDPVCQCQANDGRFSVRGISVRRGGQFADVRMRQAFPGDPESAGPNDYGIVLVRVTAGWRIWDVISEGRSVRVMLERHNACLRARGRERALAACLARAG
jgi:hypothetical protein